MKEDVLIMFDVIIIGAGVIGSVLAHELSKYECSVLVLEKENDVANGSTMANSGVIHVGYDPMPSTLKAKLNVAGAKQYPALCERLHVTLRQTGSLTIARDEAQFETLKDLKQRAIQNKVEDVTLITKEEVEQLEPHLKDKTVGALYAKNTAVLDAFELCIAAMEEALLNGVSLQLNSEVKGINQEADHYVVSSTTGDYETRMIVNAAGLFSDEIAKLTDESFDMSVRPRSGTYYVLAKDYHPFSHVIYPVPDERGKGILVVPTVHGNTLLGPTSTFIDEKTDKSVTQESLDQIQAQLDGVLDAFPAQAVIRSFTGLRAAGSQKDFYIAKDKTHQGIIHLVGIESPGLASAPAIANEVMTLLNADLNLIKKQTHQNRQAPIRLATLSREEKNALIAQNKAYGRIVCRCEGVSEGEIVDCIHRLCGGRSVKGIKKRCRPGMGKCQGGFCEPLIVNLLAKELGIAKEAVLYDEATVLSHPLTKRGDENEL